MCRIYFSIQHGSSRSVYSNEGFIFYGGGRANSNVRKEMEAALYRRLGHDFLFEATLSEEVMTSPASLKSLAVRSELAGITQNVKRPRHVQAMVLLHDSVARNDSPVVYI